MHRPRSLLLPAPAEPFAGWVNVHEVDGPLGGALLMFARSVQLWTETLPTERAELFAAGGEPDRAADLEHLDVPDALAGSLHVLATLRSAPGEARAAAVSQACDAVSAWAEAEGHPGVAVAWARLAAVVYPANVAAAYRVGILSRRRVDYPTAEAWLQHAGGMGRKHGDWYLFARATNSLGNLHAQRGDFARARATLNRALQAARRPRGRIQGGRKRLRTLEGEILHDLMTVAVYTGDYPAAEHYAAVAFERMRTGHPRLPVLAHDIAGLWMERGYFGRALPVFEAVLPLLQDAAVRAHVITNLLRAAGAAGGEETFQRHYHEARTLLQDLGAAAPAASWACLARGAASLGQWEIAEAAATRGLEAAETRQEADQLAEIPSILESIRNHRYADIAPGPVSTLEEQTAQSLAGGLIESLTALQAGE